MTRPARFRRMSTAGADLTGDRMHRQRRHVVGGLSEAALDVAGRCRHHHVVAGRHPADLEPAIGTSHLPIRCPTAARAVVDWTGRLSWESSYPGQQSARTLAPATGWPVAAWITDPQHGIIRARRALCARSGPHHCDRQDEHGGDNPERRERASRRASAEDTLNSTKQWVARRSHRHRWSSPAQTADQGEGLRIADSIAARLDGDVVAAELALDADALDTSQIAGW